MITDIFGKTRYKVGLHIHTTRSDGAFSPNDAIAYYRRRGYDALALTDHYEPGETHLLDDGFPILSGVEYNNPSGNGATGVYHILGIGYDTIPEVKTAFTPAQFAAAIHAAGGIAVLAHPYWSLNDPATVADMDFFDATEIYNTVSGVHASDRAYSGTFVDLLACRHRAFPLTAADDSHYYDNDAGISFVMVAADSSSPADLLSALRRGDFYATQGPEIHLVAKEYGVEVFCSPAVHVSFHSNLVWAGEANQYGDAITHAYYPYHDGEFFIRAEVTDAEGKCAWSHVLFVDKK